MSFPLGLTRRGNCSAPINSSEEFEKSLGVQAERLGYLKGKPRRETQMGNVMGRLEWVSPSGLRYATGLLAV